MTDKTAQNNTGNTMNDPAASSKTRNTTPDSEPQIKALPQADTLKARFKAGSIPLQTDFANLIDLANMGRQVVGGAEDQTGPANGFTLSSTGLLELKPNTAKGISIDQDGVAIKLKTISGLTIDNDGVSVKPKADSGIELKDSAGISLKPGNGISVDRDGIAVKVEGNKGLQANNNGVSVKVGNGVAVNNSGVNIKLAKGYETNLGGGQGIDGTTTGSAGGLNLTANGLSVDAGDGIQINTHGVSIKLAPNSGLSANEAYGLNIITGGGIQIESTGGINVRPGNGVVINNSGVNVKLSKGTDHSNGGGGQGTDGTTSGTTGGLVLGSDGLSVDAGSGIRIDSLGVSIKLTSKSCLSADESSGLSFNFPIGFGMLCKTEYDPNKLMRGIWTYYGNFVAGVGTFSVWIRVS